MLLRHQISDMILEVADEKEVLTTSDFQARVEVVGRKIIDRVRGTPTS